MERKPLFLIFILVASFLNSFAQNPPWENPLQIAWSADGQTFSTPAIYQDSAGVPSVIRWKGDTLICAFQWFRQPMNSPSWDRVAVKFSYDNGQNWTVPTPIILTGFPANYQRPFDPTLTLTAQDSIRIYFSSSDGMPMGLDSTVNTYSALSGDGIHYTFEPNPRVDHPSNRVIDPAVIYFNMAWHYLAPIGAPQQGAYHYISPNGVNFSQVADIPSDNTHNWTGNYVVYSPSILRFYGSSPGAIWYNSSPNGGMWTGFVNTNIQGGDPSVLKVADSSFVMIFLGKHTPTQVPQAKDEVLRVHPCPARDHILLSGLPPGPAHPYQILSLTGKILQTGTTQGQISLESIPTGMYLLQLDGRFPAIKIIKE
ncbi:MAG: T9SS type A sorting domain-containing protein [Bacteroidia bacterium]|nr:T9SS type A sorting domain-containing protein [Bacteroidia bacterium]